MTASYGRTKTRQWTQETATLTGFAFYDTVNQAQDPTDAVWWTVEFNAEAFEGTFCQRGYLEEGFVLLTVMAEPGTGDTGAITAMEQILPDIMSKIDPSQRLVFESHEPLREGSDGSADRWYRVSVPINYRLSL